MFEVGDSITYDMTIKNESEEDYMIDENTFKTDSEYIEYTLKTNDNSNVVKSQSSKDVSLTVTYKKEVDDNLLNNNKFDASNNLKLSLNTNDKEKPLDTIVTDNIKESVDPIKVTNPQTESFNIKLIVAILVLVTIIIMFTIYSKKQYIKYFIILIPLFIIPMVYAICKVDIEVESTIEIEKKFNGNGFIYVEKSFSSFSYAGFVRNGASMGFMKEIGPVPKWCAYDKRYVDVEHAFCVYDTKESCEEDIGYCFQKTDGSYNSCRDAYFAFDDYDYCLASIDDYLAHGGIPDGEYDCTRDTYSQCELGSAIEGDYTTLIDKVTNRTFYKYYVEDYIVVDSYLCFVTDKVYCLLGGEGYAEENYEVLEQQEEWFEENGGSCTFEDNGVEAECTGAGYNCIYINSDGIAIREGTSDSCISKYGVSACAQ